MDAQLALGAVALDTALVTVGFVVAREHRSHCGWADKA